MDWKHAQIVDAILQLLANYTGLVISNLERSFVLEVGCGTEGYKRVLLQPNKRGQFLPVGYCSKLKGDKCPWTTLEGILYTIRYCLHKFTDLLQICPGFEIRTIVLE